MAQSTLRWPMRSPMTPNIGASSVPRCCSDANTVSINTDRVSTSTYQPRISVSISNAHEVARSAGHWKRKLRTRKGASVAAEEVALKTGKWGQVRFFLQYREKHRRKPHMA